MAYEPRLITPFKESGLSKYYRPYLVGQEAFPDIADAYPWRGQVIKRDGFSLLAQLPSVGGANQGPVMGLRTFDAPVTSGSASNINSLVAFNPTNAYLYDAGAQTFNNVSFYADGNPFTWTGGTDDYFWSVNYVGSLWVTNTYNSNGDPIRFMNQNDQWGNQTPILGGSGGTQRLLKTAFILIAHKGRLIALNTTENVGGGASTRYANRARWSQLANPYVPDATILSTGADTNGFIPDVDAWNDGIPGKGGFLDADTNESIVSAAIIKDVLIVFFTNSTWRLRFTGNNFTPFIWERINTQFGSESVMSTIPFDDYAMTFSRRGWIKADTNQVQRFDLQIPDVAFNIEADANLIGLRRVHGIRDYYREIAYFTYPSIGNDNANLVYNYNYREDTWSKFNQFFKCFGTFRAVSDITWADLPQTWTTANFNWFSNLNIGMPFIVSGDQNATGSLAGNVYICYDNQIPKVQDYQGLANAANFNFSIQTKEFNPYLEQGHRCKLGYFDVYCQGSPGGQISVNYSIDDQNTSILTKKVNTFPSTTIAITLITPGLLTTSVTTILDHGLTTGESVRFTDILGTIGIPLNNNTFVITVTGPTTFTIAEDTSIYTYTSGGFIDFPNFTPVSNSFYVRVVLGSIARLHQLTLTMSPDQLADPIQGKAGFQLLGIVLWTRKCGRLKR